jgi:hypothetical protein
MLGHLQVRVAVVQSSDDRDSEQYAHPASVSGTSQHPVGTVDFFRFG